jgi:uncharacterized membrane protein YphA (DoxX/SURF4 family)
MDNAAEITDKTPVLQKIALRFFLLFSLGFIGSFSFPRSLLPDLGALTSPFFEKWAAWTGRHFFGFQESFFSPLISDSRGFYLHALNLIIASLVLATAWAWFGRKKKEDNILRYGFIVFIRYYLALQLLVYGFSKLFKWQFYLPEPNTLFTPLGYLHRDILYWSVMGVSRSYTVFSGLMEVIPALLLLFRPTRLIGALIAAGVMLNVVAINFSYDISVKLYSAFLLLLSLIVAAPDARRLFFFFAKNQALPCAFWQPRFSRRRLYLLAKTAVIGLILWEALHIYVASGNFNDDRAPRPAFHGAWEVSGKEEWRRLFVHRKGYLIVQDRDDKMQDYGLTLDTIRSEWILEEWESGRLTSLDYRSETEDALFVSGDFFGDTIQIHLRKIPLNELPLLLNEFHWSID